MYLFICNWRIIALHKLPVLYSSFPLATCFIHGSVYASVPLDPFLSPCPSPAMSTSPLSTAAFLVFPCRQLHQIPYTCVKILNLLTFKMSKRLLIFKVHILKCNKAKYNLNFRNKRFILQLKSY